MKYLSLVLAIFVVQFLANCSKDNPASPVPGSGCQPGSETWTLSGGLAGTMTISRDSTCNLTVSGTVVTLSGDTVQFVNVILSIASESVDFTAAQAIVVQGNVACTLAVSASAIEGAGSGSFELTFATGAGNTSGTFNATRTAGSDLTASAASVAGSNSTPTQTTDSDTSLYAINGSTVTVTYFTVYSYAYCTYNDSLIHHRDTSSYSLQYTVVLSGGTLTMSRVLASQNAVVTLQYSFVSESPVNGLIGSWRFSDFSYTVDSGELTAGQIEDLEAEAMYMQNSGMHIQITDTEVITTENADPDDYSWADAFITNWNAYDSSLYNATIVKINDNTVKLIGNTTGEIVVLMANPEGDITYISSNYLQQRTTEYNEPATCPNPADSWFESEFLQDNTNPGVLYRRPARTDRRLTGYAAVPATRLFAAP